MSGWLQEPQLCKQQILSAVTTSSPGAVMIFRGSCPIIWCDARGWREHLGRDDWSSGTGASSRGLGAPVGLVGSDWAAAAASTTDACGLPWPEQPNTVQSHHCCTWCMNFMRACGAASQPRHCSRGGVQTLMAVMRSSWAVVSWSSWASLRVSRKTSRCKISTAMG